MKNFDIENLERKNICEVPDDFFAKMQENVLKATVESTPVYSIPEAEGRKNWWYAAAAAVALLLGTTFFLNRGNTETAMADNTQTKGKSAVLSAPASTVNSIEEPTESAQNYHTFVSDLTSVEKENQTVTKTEEVLAANKTKAAPAKTAKPTVTAVPVEQILENFSEEDLEMLAQNTEQDIYLDLYY